jgi:hypothetical protein
LIKSFLFFSFIAFSLLPTPSYASSYDEDVLEIVSKIIPRLVLMSSQKINVQTQINICVLYNKLDERDASVLIDKIRKNYPFGIKNFSIVPIKNEYEKIGECRNNQIAFMFNADDQTINSAVRILNQNHLFSMSYNPNYLDNGVEASLFLGRKVAPYINIGALRENKIEVDNALIQISKIYSHGDGR